MTVDPSHADSFDDIISRLVAGESPHRLVIALRPPRDVESLKRCAVVDTFDREAYEDVLAFGQAGVLPFDDLVELPEVERVPRTIGRYRLSAEARTTYWQAWWFDQPEGQDLVLPPVLAELVWRLTAFYREKKEPVDELAQLVLVDADAARRLFEAWFAEADGRSDLPLCQDLLNALNDPDRAELIDPALLELHDERAAYLQARSHFLLDFLRAGTFYEPEGTLDTYHRLLFGDGERVLQLHAPGGSGKTMELRWLLSRVLIPQHTPLGRGRIPGTLVDFDFLEPVNVTRTPWLVLLEVATQLNHQLPGYPFKEFLEAYGWAAPLLLREVTNPTRVVAASRRLRNQRSRLARSVRNRFLATLNSVIDDGTPVVMAFDTLEEVHLRPDGDLDGLLRLLREVHDGAPGVRLVLAGRYPVSERAVEIGLPPFVSRELPEFTSADADRYLTRRGVADPALRDAIVTKADGGRPFRLSLLADLVQQQPSLTPEQVARYEDDMIYLVLRVINRVSNPDVRWLLRYGVVPRTLDLEFVRVMEPHLRSGMSGDTGLDDPSRDVLPNDLRGDGFAFPTSVRRDPAQPLDVERIWGELQAYAGTSSWVNTAPDNPNALRIHPDVVTPMRKLIRPHPVHAVLQREAAEYYERQAAVNPQRREVWLREAIYHRFQSEGHAAGAYWRRLLDDVGLDEPEVREALAAEVLGPDYVDEVGRPRLWHDDVPMITEETVAEAMSVRANALAQIVRLDGMGPEDRRWNKVDQIVAGVERLRQVRGPDGPDFVPHRRLAYAQAALALKSNRLDVAEQVLIEALEHPRTLDRPLDTEEAYDKVRLPVLLGDVQLAMRKPAAFDSYRAALAELPSLVRGRRRLEPIIRTRLVHAHQVANRYDEAEAQVSAAREPADLDHDHATALRLLAIRNDRSTGRLERAKAQVEALGAEVAAKDRVREAVLVALAQHDPEGARRLLHPPGPRRIDPLRPVTREAWEHELTGLTSASLADYGASMTAFEAARALWHDEGDLEGEVRCHTHAALLQIRDVGNLSLAEQHLAEAADLHPGTGRREWLRLVLARVELLVRQERAADGANAVRLAIDVLKQHHASPTALVRAAVEGLATGDPQHVTELLDVLESNLALITPASARITALRYLERVPTSQGVAAHQAFQRVHDLLDLDRDRFTAADLALLELTLAEVHRLRGHPEDAGEVLASAARHGEHLASPHFVRRWARALDRIGRPVTEESPGVPRYLDACAELPPLRGAFAVERAEAAVELEDQLAATRWMDRAVDALGQAGDQETLWHIRLEFVKGEVGRINEAANARAQALAIVGRLHSTIHVSPLSSRFAGVEPEAPAMHTVLARAVIDALRQQVRPWGPDAQSVVDMLIRLVEEIPTGRGDQDASEELANRLDQNWRLIARALGQLILQARPASLPYPALGLGLEVRHRRWSMMPWELAYRPGTDRLLSLDSVVGPLYRALSAKAVRSGEVSFVQLALNRLNYAKLLLDGELGPMTRRALAAYQKDHGLEPSGQLTIGLRTRLQSALTTEHKPLVVLVRQSPGRQLMSHRGHANTGVDLSRLYRRYGFEVEVVENPTLQGLSAVVRSLISGGRVPSLLHLSGGLRESNGAVTFSFLSGSGEEESYRGYSDDIPVSSMDGLLATFPNDQVAPIVVLDVDRPRGTAETALHLLQRNAFAGELFSLGRCAAVLGTGLVGREGTELYEHLVGSLADGSTLSEVITNVRQLGSAPGPREDLGLERVLSFVGIALFTNLPWLRLPRRRERGA
ncbi:putative peptidoglycan binding protein [Saccharothrix carnea]|uniref:Putative peptidoglycan binding protein n=1 Tax=Saccharothrix carnea TaxID=1280637 RepID=A0A2P8HZS3_SACCR|nr:peptidoglycan-binding protein [Saccharothrix carnea]PSL51719.1 putative peptidoglycan binding protein [Saccharothrix carnea]